MHRDFIYNDDDWAYGLVPENGEAPFILKKPVWQKGRRYKIKEPTYNTWGPKIMISNVSIQGKYKSTLMDLKVRIIFNLDSEPNKQNLFEILLETQKDSEILSVDKYIESIFEKINDPEMYNKIAEDYATQKIPENQLLQTIVDVTNFPEKLFSFDKNNRLEFKDFKFSACKGFGCGI